jgi:hypothetical protein
MDRETIITYVRENTRIKTDRVDILCQYFIDVVQDIHIARNIYEHQFSFLKAYGYLSTTPSYSTGTVTVTQDSATVTGSGTAFTSAMVGSLIKFNNEDNYYEISSHVNTGEITLKTAYIGATDMDATFEIYKVNYDLASDFGNMRWIKQLDSPTRVIPLAEIPFTQFLPNEFNASGNIKGYVMGGRNSVTNCHMIRFTPIQTGRKMLYYCYDKELPSINIVGGTSIIPSKWHMLFVHKLSEMVFDNHGLHTKARVEEAKFNALLKTFINEDLSINRDDKKTMADESLYKGDETPYVHLPSQYSPDL